MKALFAGYHSEQLASSVNSWPTMVKMKKTTVTVYEKPT